MLHRLTVVGIVGFWLVMTGTLVRRWILEVRPEFVPGTYRSVLTRERQHEQWRMGIYLPGKNGLRRIGHTQTVFTYFAGNRRYRIHSFTDISFPMDAMPFAIPFLEATKTDLQIDATTWVSAGFQLEEVLIHVSSPIVQATCRGKAAGDKLVLHTQFDGVEQEPIEVPLPPEGTVSQGLSPLLALPPLSEGMSWSALVINPMTLQPSEVEMRVLRREEIEWNGATVDTHLLEIRSGPIRSHAWVSTDGQVLKEKTLFGLTLIKEVEPPAEESEAPQ